MTDDQKLIKDLSEALSWCLGVFDFSDSPSVEERIINLIDKAEDLTKR